jgi:Transcriptional regulators
VTAEMDGDSAAHSQPQADRVAHLLKLAHKATSKALQTRLADTGVSYGQWTFLRILWVTDGLTVSELARRAGVATPAATVTVREMEQRGYVTREQRDGNQKSVYLLLTPAGRALEAELVPLALDINDKALAGLSPRERQSLRRMLAHIIANLNPSE